MENFVNQYLKLEGIPTALEELNTVVLELKAFLYDYEKDLKQLKVSELHMKHNRIGLYHTENTLHLYIDSLHLVTVYLTQPKNIHTTNINFTTTDMDIVKFIKECIVYIYQYIEEINSRCKQYV